MISTPGDALRHYSPFSSGATKNYKFTYEHGKLELPWTLSMERDDVAYLNMQRDYVLAVE